jgi:hypothetical protein
LASVIARTAWALARHAVVPQLENGAIARVGRVGLRRKHEDDAVLQSFGARRLGIANDRETEDLFGRAQ